MSSDGKRASLERKIKNIDQQIVVLQELRAQCLQKLYSLEQAPIPPIQKSFAPTLPDNKATIFKSYFHGRDDVYAKLWVNNRTGKRGYSPDCKNELVS